MHAKNILGAQNPHLATDLEAQSAVSTNWSNKGTGVMKNSDLALSYNVFFDTARVSELLSCESVPLIEVLTSQVLIIQAACVILINYIN